MLAHPALDGLFLLTILTVTFHKLQWELAGSLTLSDILTSVYLVVFAWDRLERRDGRFGRTAAVAFGFFLAFRAALPRRLLQPRYEPGARPVGKGDGRSSSSTSVSS